MEKKYFIGLILILSLIIIWNLNSKNTELVYNLNESYCNNIETPDMKITCMAMFKKDFNICKENFYFNDYCVDKVFQVTKILTVLAVEGSQASPSFGLAGARYHALSNQTSPSAFNSSKIRSIP